jgi:hypothetical protein
MPSLAKFACFALAASLAGLPLGARAQANPDDSPFAPLPGTPGAAAAAAAPEALELAGASATGQGTEVCLFDTTTKHSMWIAVGANRDGVQVMSYDPDRDQAVVTVNGERKTLSMRKGEVGRAPVPEFVSTAPVALAAAGPSISLAPTSGPVDPKARETERAEREARMMVSDLLDIGMQQRKAFAEKRRQALLQGSTGGQ